MKKILIRAVSLVLILVTMMSVAVVAHADNINLGVQIQNKDNEITVTVDNSTGSNNILATEKPTLTIACDFEEAHVKYGNKVIASTLASGKITFAVTRGGTYTIFPGTAEVTEDDVLVLEDEALLNQDEVWIDGVAYPVEKDGDKACVRLPEDSTIEAGACMVTYEYNESTPADKYTQYPTGMQVWIMEEDTQGDLKPTHVSNLDNILGYCGISIRITGKQGIRMITSIDQGKKNALITAGLGGYKLLEYGTAVCWSDDLIGNKPMTLDQSYVKSNYAYKRGVADPIFKLDGAQLQYTNVLVGFSMDECEKDIAMRPYMILEGPEGEQVTVYGGIVHRSIGYIAYRNRDVFAVGSDAYNYVWNIIHHVYGNKYDADYKG